MPHHFAWILKDIQKQILI